MNIEIVHNFVKKILMHAESGHDYWHALRVLKNAENISSDYSNIDHELIEIAALTHDISDRKFFANKNNIQLLKNLLSENGISKKRIDFLLDLIENISFSSENLQQNKSLELQILQDADRLDAIGAIGIARAFSYGAYKKREFYNPEIKPKLNMSKEEYKKSESTTINHFYEKLLTLKDSMNTPKGKEIAKQRHEFMEMFLYEFFDEWNGKK